MTKETVTKRAAKQIFGVEPEQVGTIIMSFKRLSERNRVSVAWLVRNAVTEHLQAQAPLFAKTRARS